MDLGHPVVQPPWTQRRPSLTSHRRRRRRRRRRRNMSRVRESTVIDRHDYSVVCYRGRKYRSTWRSATGEGEVQEHD